MAGRVHVSEWGDAGGIVALADLIDAHRGAFEYDWRARLHTPLSEVGKSMTWGEALRLTKEILLDPSAHVTASVYDWSHPVPWPAMVAMDAYDLAHQVAWGQSGGKGSRPKPYPRPWPDRVTKRFAPSVSQDEVIAALRSVGHTDPIPPH